MKVWIPIDLPDGYLPTYVMLQHKDNEWDRQIAKPCADAAPGGDEGWELIGPCGDGAIWFKRRSAPEGQPTPDASE